MRLDAILHKTKTKGSKEEVSREPPSIAEEERPYDLVSASEIGLEPGRKPTTKWQQTDNKVATNRQQSGNKPATKWQQTDNKKNNFIEKWQQTDNKSGNKPATNRQQKLGEICQISEIVGLQKVTLILIYYECKKARSHITPPITLKFFSSQLKTSAGSIKTTLQRLEEKGFIVRILYKNGRGGWSQYELLDQPYQELLLLENNGKLAITFEWKKGESGNKPTTKWQQTDNKVATELATTPPSSSYIETTTTSDSIDYRIDSEWASINIEPLKDINFYNHHIEQIRKNKWLTPQQVQDSINAFAFDLKINNIGGKLKGSPINFFMGIMRKKEPYIPPTNYEDPQTRSLKAYLEKKRDEDKKKEELEKEIFLLAYKEWENTLTDEDVIKIIPELRYREPGSILRQSNLEKYFRDTKWVSLKEKLSDCNS